jgi:hypothetical protein
MSVGTCSSCGASIPTSSLIRLNGQAFCEACLGKTSTNAADGMAQPAQSGTPCARCGATKSPDGASLSVAGQPPLCSPCHTLVNAWPYPQWLKISLVVLLLLLAVSLINGKRYFQAGRTMYIGEHLVETGKYAQALPYLKETLKIAPGSDKAVLLTAKAALLSGDVQTASAALQGHNGGKFEDGADQKFLEVNALWERANDALKKADEAADMDKAGKSADAAAMMHKAAAEYPELHDLAEAADYYDEGAAFDRKDYDGFLKISERRWKERADSNAAAALASALACKYAITGDGSYKRQSEEMLTKSFDLAKNDPEATKTLEEFAERNRYRLANRVIISKAEYDAKFRSGQAAAH